MNEQRREDFKHAIIIEEAHHVLSDERRSLVGGQSVMDIIFREIREFGESLILLDQHPSKISLYALGNTYTTICMNLKHKTDINAMGQCLLLDKERDILGALDVGEAVVKLQGRIAKPFQIIIPKFIIEKGKITDADIKQRMQNLAPAFEETDFRLPDNSGLVKPKELKPEPKKKSMENAEIEFLKDVREHSYSGVAARYERLGLSVRQGQTLIEKLFEEGLIEQQLETTKTGRVRVIHLTEKGRSLLSKAN
jgi:hypothetical protein